MQQIVDSLKSSMRLLVASVRSPDDMVALASQVGSVVMQQHCNYCQRCRDAPVSMQGCNTFTISPDCAAQLLSEPLTRQAALQFERDAAALGAS